MSITLKLSKKQAAILHAAIYCAMGDGMDNDTARNAMQAVLDQIEEKYPAFPEIHASEWMWDEVTPQQFDDKE